MRPIKFRAWDKDKKWMVYDVQDAYDGMWSERNSDEINDYYGYVSTFQSFTDEESFNFMQYTGLKDKNGVEIYEGDIVKGQITLGYKRTGVIKFDTDAFCFVEFWEEGMLTMFEENPDRMIIYNGFGGHEVIGNIYENPELLE